VLEVLEVAVAEPDTAVDAAQTLWTIGSKQARSMLRAQARRTRQSASKWLPALTVLIDNGDIKAPELLTEAFTKPLTMIDRAAHDRSGHATSDLMQIPENDAREVRDAILALESYLDQWADLVNPELLRRCAGLANAQPVLVTVQQGCSIPVAHSSSALIDAARVRQLARQELIRRGEPA
jgi:hypothetical protein